MGELSHTLSLSLSLTLSLSLSLSLSNTLTHTLYHTLFHSLSPDVDTKDRQGRSKVEKWTKECDKRVYKNKELFMVSEKIYVAQEVL